MSARTPPLGELSGKRSETFVDAAMPAMSEDSANVGAIGLALEPLACGSNPVDASPPAELGVCWFGPWLQRYLALKKQRPPRTLQ